MPIVCSIPPLSSSLSNDLLNRIKTKEAKVGIIGLGYVGLPLVMVASQAGYHVVGFDIDQQKIDKLKKNETYIKHISSSSIRDLNNSGKFHATSDFSELKDVDAILMCVPTPLSKYRDPDMSYVISTTESVAAHLRKDHVIILESTTYPGTCREVIQPILEKTGLKASEDFFIAYSPEREDPGNPDFSTKQIPKVVGGLDLLSLELALALYSGFGIDVIPVSSLDTAEAVKLTENIFRCINIALVNELKVVYQKMGIDVWEVINAAKTKPFGFMPFYPGPGLGGHCIPIDPFYLTWKAKEFGLSTKFIELAGEINTAMPSYVSTVLAESLSERFQKSLKGSKILILGMAYKKNVDDIRESPALVVIEHLMNRGVNVEYYDPYVPEIHPMREHPTVVGMKCSEITREKLSQYDAVFIITDHDNVDYDFICRHSSLIVDTRNATHAITDEEVRAKIVKA
jgi:UDP-N-acetyl-D-glucosamine dehydrogenase